jgi:hypothetical protein
MKKLNNNYFWEFEEDFLGTDNETVMSDNGGDEISVEISWF